jgi:hypothetical protein
MAMAGMGFLRNADDGQTERKNGKGLEIAAEKEMI